MSVRSSVDFPQPEAPSIAMVFRVSGEIRRGDDLDAAAVRLGVEFSSLRASMIGSGLAGSGAVVGVLMNACLIAQVDAARTGGCGSHHCFFPGYNGMNTA